MYTIYRIPKQNKVGLAKDVVDRVEVQQGISPGDYDILAKDIVDLAVARMIEKEAHKTFKCEHEEGEDIIDMVLKKRASKSWKKTNQSNRFKSVKGVTVGFPAPIDQFKTWVDAKDSIIIEDGEGKVLTFANDADKAWLIKNAKGSKFASADRATYIYIAAAHKYFNQPKTETNESISTGRVDGLLDLVYKWADNRGILEGSIETQSLKLGEEFGELQKAVLKSRSEDIKDAIGDIIVVLVSIAHFNGHSIADALQMAYDTISKRTGFTNDKGDFIKTHFNGEAIKDTL